MPELKSTEQQSRQTLALGAAVDAFKVLLVAAKASLATAAATVAADGGASGTSKSQVASANTLVQALDTTPVDKYCYD